jgi:hypothetical protein
MGVDAFFAQQRLEQRRIGILCADAQARCVAGADRHDIERVGLEDG